MKKNLFLFLVLICPMASLQAQDKVLEKSGKIPGWLYSLDKEFITVAGTGKTIQEAQVQALNEVRAQIVASVAVHVKTESESSQTETMTNKTVGVFLNTYASKTSIESRKVPFLQGVSLSKVESYFWIKKERKDKSIYFTYHLRYPFPREELAQLVFEFKKLDQQFSTNLLDIQNELETVSSVEQIERNIAELKVLSDYFLDGRKSQAEWCMQSYFALYSSIELVEVAHELGTLTYCLRLGSRAISTTKKPIIKAECARIVSLANSSNNVVIKYDFSSCYEDPENNIQVKYRFGNVDVQKKFHFDITKNLATIFVNEPVHFTCVSQSLTTIDVSTMDMTISSKYATPLTIEKITLEIPGCSPIILENVGLKFSGKGNHDLKFRILTPISKELTSTIANSMKVLSGRIQYKSDATGEVKTYRIYNQRYTTDW